MNERFVVPPDAAERQRAAADPASSAWVSANAGAGKTKVLTDRVIRLMLAGSPPSRILCLTFTKAAAAEMTIRVFETLGDWVTMEDRPLADALLALTGEKPKPALLGRARRLFARAVETPGGLKIETIHAFCERLLHLVPFEADVPPRFAVLDDAEAAEIMAEARGAVLTEAAGAGQDSDLGRALDRVTQEASGDPLIQLLAEAVADPALPTAAAAQKEAAERLAATLDLASGETPEAVRRTIVEDGIPASEWPAIAAELEATGQSSNRERAAELRHAARAADLFDRAEHYGSIFFTKEGRPAAQIATRKVPAALRERLEAERQRLVGLVERLRAAEALERTLALYRLAAAVRERYEDLKRRLGALDFADLIERTVRLLEGGAAAWVLYRLDRGIDHVLVDEAQDTNADQWRILRKLTEDFTAGAGRPGRLVRTIFAVGDPKQSIYSFQGADPRLFEDGRMHWLALHRGGNLGFADVRLALSFRSAPTILRCVDATFAVKAHFQGLSFEHGLEGTIHESARPRAPGLIEIWETQLPDPKTPDPDAWSLPVDTPDQRSPALATARRVADAVRHWTTVPETGRVWRPGEILILARRRGPAFFAVIRALKANGVPVAGADRIDVNQQIAVNDLVAAGQAALLPGHDLALAAALKSPLVALDDDDLVRIAADRPEGRSLEAALEAAAPADRKAAQGWEALRSWRDAARRHGPFGFYATLLGPGGGRRRLVERLGGEAQDAIDTFLCRAQAEETSLEAPSLTAFLARFEASEHVIKRDPESRTDEVRVMTVHGAKGLEAPLVVLLDGCEVGGRDPRLIAVPTGPDGATLPVWAPRKDEDPKAVAKARKALRARMLEEHNRLLYVALTRARDRLVLAPYTGMHGREPEEAWCGMVRRGLAAEGAELAAMETPYGPVEMLREGAAETVPDTPAPVSPPIDVPDWLARRVPEEADTLPPLRPSSALGAADRAPERTALADRARRRGILIHALLDHLVDHHPAARGEEAARFLAARAAGLDAAERERLAAQTLALLDHPELSALFGPGSRGEAAVAGSIGPPGAEREVSGQIDRLHVGEDGIVVADIKTGRPPADGIPPAPYAAQLAVYAALLREAHPGLPLRALLVWPEGPLVMSLTEETLATALDQIVGGTPAAPAFP